MTDHLTKLREMREVALAGGGPERVADQDHQRGGGPVRIENWMHENCQ